MDVIAHTYLMAVLLAVSAARNVNVSTGSGTFVGREGVSASGEKYHAFLGVRFARSERFSKPVQEARLAGVYNATFSRDGCMQVMVFEDGRVEGKEDCLFLDIYVPANHSSDSPKSVMVWIHGGGLVTGKAQQFDGSSLATKGDVIVVVIQYRLGPFGFLSTADNALPGNYGLWDQLIALQWVRDDVGYFGGNPHSVTIFGESSGGCSVNLHLLSAQSKGLFKRVISQSSVPCISTNHLRVTYALAKLVGCFPDESSGFSKKGIHTKIVDCLKRTDATALSSASWPLDDQTKFGVLDFLYKVSIDGEFVTKGMYALLADTEYLTTTSFPNVDLMMSVNDNEGLGLYFIARHTDKHFHTSEAKAFKLLNNFHSNLLTPYLKSRYDVISAELLDTITFEYIYPLHLNTKEIHRDSPVKLITDMFVTHTLDLVTSHSGFAGPGKTYLYLFDHDQHLTKVFKGMIHGMDLVYTFGFAKFQMKAFVGSANATIPPSDREISDILIKFLTDFAKTGNPSNSVSNKISGGWPEFERNNQSYLSLNSNMSIKQRMYPRVTSFWENLVPRLASAALNRSEPVIEGGCVSAGSRPVTRVSFFILLMYALLN